jgi:predicted metalloendopeptidase
MFLSVIFVTVQAFGVVEGDPMYLPPAQRVDIW